MVKAIKVYKVIGVMSGTSLDGLDVAYCQFEKRGSWTFRILDAKTYRYPSAWKSRLSAAHNLDGGSLMALHMAYGRYVGDMCRKFMGHYKIKIVDFIASHGHTVFHQPDMRFTFQLGDGSSIMAAAGLPVIFGFRTLDVALGGEGAPLVPIGDGLLFSKYDVCLNLGGIANVSMHARGTRKAFDVCFCNMALNHLMSRIDLSFDKGGKRASQGRVLPVLYESISQTSSSYCKDRPSLSRELFEKEWRPMLDNPGFRLEDVLRTVCESVAKEIVQALPSSKKPLKILATGGGAKNDFLIKLIRKELAGRGSLIVPSPQIIDFKEALVFAFLGVLRSRNEINVLKSVTKASRDSSSGSIVGR